MIVVSLLTAFFSWDSHIYPTSAHAESDNGERYKWEKSCLGLQLGRGRLE